ncbi:hypothetical protein BGX21_004427 [Mortierella sp. AD011]|nr:hypothetical protein BGX20_009164 [Mortierella sp. AD010]KAF9373440.1 hypothetical protein BGX21_004427 [Mortierella sp. AD011]
MARNDVFFGAYKRPYSASSISNTPHTNTHVFATSAQEIAFETIQQLQPMELEQYILDSQFHSQQAMNDEFRSLPEPEGPIPNLENCGLDFRSHSQQAVGDESSSLHEGGPDIWFQLASQSDRQRLFPHETQASIHQSSSYEDSYEGSRSDTAPGHMDVEYLNFVRDITHYDTCPMSEPASVPDPAPVSFPDLTSASVPVSMPMPITVPVPATEEVALVLAVAETNTTPWFPPQQAAIAEQSLPSLQRVSFALESFSSPTSPRNLSNHCPENPAAMNVTNNAAYGVHTLTPAHAYAAPIGDIVTPEYENENDPVFQDGVRRSITNGSKLEICFIKDLVPSFSASKLCWIYEVKRTTIYGAYKKRDELIRLLPEGLQMKRIAERLERNADENIPFREGKEKVSYVVSKILSRPPEFKLSENSLALFNKDFDVYLKDMANDMIDYNQRTREMKSRPDGCIFTNFAAGWVDKCNPGI